jgi:hypothetical protein
MDSAPLVSGSDSSLSIVNRLGTGQTRNRFSTPVMVHRVSFLQAVRTASEAHPVFYLMGSGTSFPGVQWQHHEADHSNLCRTDVRNAWT